MKNKSTKNFSKTKRTLKYRDVSVVDYRYIMLFFGCVIALFISSCFLATLSYGKELGYKPTSSDQSEEAPKTGKSKKTVEELVSNAALTRIIDLNGVVGIDGSLRVLEANYTKVFDLVQTSTPVAPASNHARIWLETTDGDLKILFSNGVIKTIATN